MANAPIHQIWMSSMLAIIRPMSMQIGRDEARPWLHG